MALEEIRFCDDGLLALGTDQIITDSDIVTYLLPSYMQLEFYMSFAETHISTNFYKKQNEIYANLLKNYYCDSYVIGFPYDYQFYTRETIAIPVFGLTSTFELRCCCCAFDIFSSTLPLSLE